MGVIDADGIVVACSELTSIGEHWSGEAYLSEVGSQVYAVGTNGYDITEDVKSRLAARGDQMITNQDIPVPTWFVNYDAADHSLQYYITLNGLEG